MLNIGQTRQKNAVGGFTLIELLIVIAIIGVLAATVLVVLGSQTNSATEGSVRLSVSSMRTLAYSEVAINTKLSGQALCNGIYGRVSGEKDGWEWTNTRTCEQGDLIAASGLTQAAARSSNANAAAGEICCFSSNTDWVIWGALPTADGTGATEDDIYCADSKGFLGKHKGRPQATGTNAKCK
ncbi:MAG: type II secretion system protein [Candidatus Kaiserbacteria bacterium]|nr:type II secretion system protein [Candidatus Kaiserbacteria bacterium]